MRQSELILRCQPLTYPASRKSAREWNFGIKAFVISLNIWDRKKWDKYGIMIIHYLRLSEASPPSFSSWELRHIFGPSGQREAPPRRKETASTLWPFARSPCLLHHLAKSIWWPRNPYWSFILLSRASGMTFSGQLENLVTCMKKKPFSPYDTRALSLTLV